MQSEGITGQVWCGRGFRPKHGFLTLRNGRLIYASEGAVVFDVPLLEIERLAWPWYSFSTAFDATVHGQRYYLSFLGTGNTAGSWMRGVLTGRWWRERLTEAIATAEGRGAEAATGS